MENVLNFKISSALKNLIGMELITDPYVAIFELVKNSFDAYATNVKIIFESIKDRDKTKIIIIDNGKGMSEEDLLNKWLFVAYSAKQDGTEDGGGDENTQKFDNDYRNKIKSKRIFAGAKGVGRFSCDRLGEKLNLISIKNSKNTRIENLNIDWTNFEENSKKEFLQIPVKHRVLGTIDYDIHHGTILEITQVRDQWDRNKLLKLKQSLAKLINPAQENTSNEFNIEIIANEEFATDSRKIYDREKVNGYVRNTIFETLDIKTTQIFSEISSEGDVITTTLKDRGSLIYTIKEKNIYRNLSDIKVNLFILNRAGKINFYKIMGIESVNYGSVFIYKNGFRIYPYGEVGEDFFNLDKRKAQGYNRYFGTRELLGRIEINGEDENLKETTSRDGGLIKNNSYDELVEFFYDKALKRLEKYVFEIIKWGDPIVDKETGKESPALNPADKKNEILNTIKVLSKSKDLISINYDKNFQNIIEEKKEKSVSNLLKKLEDSTQKFSNPVIDKHLEDTKRMFKELIVTKNEAEVQAEQSSSKLQKVEKELEHTTKHNLFLKSISTTDIKEVVALQHHVNRSADKINFHLDQLIEAIRKGLDSEKLINYVKRISLENEKILTVSRYVTKANFNMKAAEIEDDIIQFISEYIENVYVEYEHLKINNQQFEKIDIVNGNIEFITKFRPLEVIMVIDNLFSNSHKARARELKLTWNMLGEETAKLTLQDNGDGIDESRVDINQLFDFGYTTTEGSGIGLFHVKDIIENKMNGKIYVNTNIERGTEFEIEFNKNR